MALIDNAKNLLEKANRVHKVGFLYALSVSAFLIIIGVLANIAGFAGLNSLFAAITIITALYFLTKPAAVLTALGFSAILSSLTDLNLIKSLETSIKPIGLLFLFVTVVFVTLATFPIANAGMVLPLIVILAGLKLTTIVQKPGYKLIVLGILLFSGGITLYKMYVRPTKTAIVAEEFLKMNQENLDRQKANEIEKLREYVKKGGVLSPEQLQFISDNVNASKGTSGPSFLEKLNMFFSVKPQAESSKEPIAAPAATPNSYLQSANEAPSTNTDEAELISFVNNVITINNNGNLHDILDLYGDRVDYFGKGMVEKRYIERDKFAFYKRWPIVNCSLNGGINIQVRPERDVWFLTYNINYFTQSPVRREQSSGEAITAIEVKRIGNRFIIISEKQNVIRREKSLY